MTETHKWHVSGHVIDASPAPVTVPEDYFEKLDKERKERLRKELQQDLAEQKKKELLLLARNKQKDDKVVICNVMNVTLSCDHRAIDGAVGAKFLQVFKKIIENPILMSL